MYTPKVIIPEGIQSQYKLILYREIIKLCEDTQPVNPFKSLYDTVDGLRIALNTTNDLPGAIKHWDTEVSEGRYNYIILGDPNPSGYKESVLQRVMNECSNPSSSLINDEWFLAMINITEKNKLVVNKDLKITIE